MMLSRQRNATKNYEAGLFFLFARDAIVFLKYTYYVAWHYQSTVIRHEQFIVNEREKYRIVFIIAIVIESKREETEAKLPKKEIDSYYLHKNQRKTNTQYTHDEAVISKQSVLHL